MMEVCQMKGDQGEDYGKSREEEGDTHTPTHPHTAQDGTSMTKCS